MEARKEHEKRFGFPRGPAQGVGRGAGRIARERRAGEYDLHQMVFRALVRAGYQPRHEVALGPRCRIDFMVDGLGIEIKKGKPVRRAVMEQAARYLESGQLEGLLLVVERSANLPGRILGKPVVVLGLNRLWGVALP